MTQVNILYSGTVQGVGFRYAMQRFASDLKLTGWVRNLPDGEVEILTEGLKEDIERLIGQVDARFDGYIKEKKISFLPVQGTFKDFQIIL
ncbi:MAG TPA: acylphosphatase [Candidatus Omnitrophota bacterium]|nr:acylphosphatase [Candidatus Omnitrophota bacterium]